MASPDTGQRVVREHESAVIMTAPRPQDRQRKHPDAGMLQAEISSFRLHLAGAGKSARTIRTYTDAVQWFAAAGLPPAGRTAWAQAGHHDIQAWMSWLLDRYSAAYASNQYRALQQFFRWLAAEDELPDPMTGLRPPPVPAKLVPVFTDQELSRLEQACAGRTFAQRRDTAIIAVFTATGIRLSELAGISCHPHDPQRSDVDLWQRQITIRGKGGKDRIVKIGHHTALSLDRYLRPLPPRPGLAAAAVARDQQPRAADRRRHLPDDHPPGQASRGGRVPAPLPAPFLPHLARPRRPPKATSWNSAAGPPPRCSAATAPAPAPLAPVAPTTAS